MNIPNKNIEVSKAFKLRELLLVFCVLCSTASVFLGNTAIRFEKQQDSFSQTVNKKTTHCNWGTTRTTNSLSDFDLIEESETTDDSNEDDSIEGYYSPNTQIFFTYNNAKNLSVSGSLSFSKRVFIPLFLLHHSWKIPVA